MQIIIGVLIALFGQAAFAANAGSYLDLNLKQNRYLSDGQSSTQSSDYSFLAGDLDLEATSPRFNFKLNPVAQDSIGLNDEFYFGIPEAYVQPRRLAPSFDMTVGRQKRTWSRLDEEFNIGVWQPQLRWDYLAPKQEGLIGVFLDWSLSDNFRFSFFTSPLFLPDQGPNYQLKNGQFTSSNRWFMQPQSRVLMFDAGRAAPLYFQIDRPAEEQIIMNSSFGLGLSYQSSAPFWMNINYAYKPQNQIHLGIECAHCLLIGGPVTPGEVTAVIHPTVVKHHVVTLESGFDKVDSRGYVSLTGDFPNGSGFPAEYYESALSSAVIAGGAYQHYVFSWLGIPSWLKYSYMRVFEIQSKDKKGLVESDQVQSSLDRYPYREIAAIEWKMLVRQQRSNRLEIKNRYSYSVPEKGGWLSAAAEFGQGPVTWSLGLDFLGSNVPADSPNAGLYTRYRANDRVFGGVSYVF